MTAKQPTVETSLQARIALRDLTAEIWSIHVDEVVEWCPNSQSFNEWMQRCSDFYRLACSYADPSDVIVVALSFEPSLEIETFHRSENLLVDFFTPPSLYLLKKPLTFPSSGEEYYRLLEPSLIPASLPQGVAVVARSARSIQGLNNGWEFDNTIYIASRFHS